MHPVVSHHSAARAHGIDLFDDDASVHLTLPRNHPRLIRGVVVHRVDLPGEDVEEGVTTPLRTVLDISRMLGVRSGLVATDSALRQGLVDQEELAFRCTRAGGPGAHHIRRVGVLADGRADSPAESAARLLLVDAGLKVVPQLRLDPGGHPYDLGLPKSRVLVEIQGYEFHRSKAELERDCTTSNAAQLDGWEVLQFTGTHVRRRPQWLVDTVKRAGRRRGA